MDLLSARQRAQRDALLHRLWASTAVGSLLSPLGLLWSLLAVLRRWRLSAAAVQLSVPVVVVGNITLGGTGKTPLVLKLAKLLTAAGFKPGVVSRGYAGSNKQPRLVAQADSSRSVGDEPRMMAEQLPVAVGQDRAAAGLLLKQQGCDVIISDDGLQHYRLARNYEIAVIDGRRRLGNGHCLPAGPMRESAKRLQMVDWIFVNGGKTPSDREFGRSRRGINQMRLRPVCWRCFDGSTEIAATAWPATRRVHALCGIGNPQRFFDTLRELLLEPVMHIFPDHHHFTAEQLFFDDDLPVVMTAKDAIKCRTLVPQSQQSRYWSLEVEAVIDDRIAEEIVNELASCIANGGSQYER